jgi:hypothetical protein
MLVKGRCHEFGLPFRIQAREPNKHYPRVRQVLAKYEIAEIFIRGY